MRRAIVDAVMKLRTGRIMRRSQTHISAGRKSGKGGSERWGDLTMFSSACNHCHQSLYAHNLRHLLLFIANIGVVVHLCTFSSSPLSSSSSSQFCLSFLSVKLHNCLSRDRQLYASCQVGPMRKHRLQESMQTGGQAWNASSYRPMV